MALDRIHETDFGIFDPNATDIVAHENGWLEILKDRRTGREIAQRRNNTFQSVLAFTCLLDIDPEDQESLSAIYEPGLDLFLILMQLRYRGVITYASQNLEMLLIKHRREVPPGVEWNAPGGTLESNENVRDGMIRELQEEISGLTILGTTILSRNQCYSSGSFREFYSLGAALACGNPEIPESEKKNILAFTRIPLNAGYDWMLKQNRDSLDQPSRCGVDGKVMEAFLHLERMMKVRGDW